MVGAPHTYQIGTSTIRPMSDVFILSAARTPIGKFLGGLSTVPATPLGAVAIRAAVERAGSGAGADRRGLHGPGHPGRCRPGAGPPGGARRRAPERRRGHDHQQGLRLRPQGGDARRRVDPGRRRRRDRGRRHGEHEPGPVPAAGRAGRLSAGQRRAGRRDRPRRAVVRDLRRPHGDARRAGGRQARGDARRPGRVRGALARARPGRHRRRPLCR